MASISIKVDRPTENVPIPESRVLIIMTGTPTNLQVMGAN